MAFPYLSFICLTPVIGGLLLFLLPAERKRLLRISALVISLLPLLATFCLLSRFDRSISGLQFVERFTWISAINVDYFLGVDGLSMMMIFLTAWLTPLSILASFSIEKNIKTYFFLFLLLQTGMFGVFMALNFFHFFIFWELGLVPMFFLIKVWGSENRHYAAYKFFVYTLFGSVAMLLTFQFIYIATGSFDFIQLAQMGQSGVLSSKLLALSQRLGLPFTLGQVGTIAFLAISLAFAIKVPLWPFHTWLPDAHTQAPTAASMVLAGVLLKMGVYGFLRICLPFFPEVARHLTPFISWLILASIILGAFAAMAQQDLKRMIAYSSVNHMGYCMLGIFAATRQLGFLESTTAKAAALNGALLQMFTHGISAGALFFMVGVLYDRAHTRQLDAFGGLRKVMPVLAGLMSIAAFASLGLPGLSGFVSEFLIFRGGFALLTPFTIGATLGLLITAIYLLQMIAKIFHGPLKKDPSHHWHDMTFREIATAAPFILFMFWVGLYPAPFIRLTNQAVIKMIGIF